MFDFLVRKSVVGSAQKSIDRLTPSVKVHIPIDIPLPWANYIRKKAAVASRVNAFEETISRLSDDQLKAKTSEFRIKYQQAIHSKKSDVHTIENSYKSAATPEERENISQQATNVREELKKLKRATLDAILPEAFAVVREVGKRLLNMRHFDVQLIGGMALHEGNIAEMSTGEGKTLVATLAAYLNGLTGEGVHVVTVNDYLAKRDREWMGPIYEFLGLTVGVIQHDMHHEERHHAYSCDITYGTNNEYGFDYLRDNMVNFKQDMVQRGHNFAIVDEVDSILIDEARTPLIISGPAEESTDKYYRANEISKKLTGRRITEAEEVDAKYKNQDLTVGFDYIADEKARSVSLTETGEEKAAKLFGVSSLHDMETIEYRHHILQSLKAKEFFHVDVEYVVRDGEVIIVDEFTGRLMPGRRWSDGLHQAVEAKEGIKIERENQTLATITFQNYFRMYEKLSGMTGTAHTEANEFKEIYKLECIVIPPNRVLLRKNHSDCIYKTVKEKFAAVVIEIEDCYKRGQPVLVGTISIEKSELLSTLLKQKGIPHQVLNAKYHEFEAQIVAQAGRFKGVTIATNMAGRGTDILLGGNAEYLAKNLAEQKLKDVQDAGERQATIVKFIQQFREQVAKEHEEVVAVGGLHVLGTERHESRRIDNQLRGRSGRQGDPGSSRFYVSLQDDLMRLFASDRIMTVMDKLGMEEGQVIEHPWVTKAIEVAQKRVETHNFEIRKQLLEYDNVMNKQRETIYSLRSMILESEDVKDLVHEAFNEAVFAMTSQYLFNGDHNVEWDIEGLDAQLKNVFHYDLGEIKNKLHDLPIEEIRETICQGLLKVYAVKEAEISTDHLRRLERMLYLHTIDAKWKDHLYAMDQLKEGVGLRSFANRDPLLEYKREGFQMFEAMYNSINQEVAETIFKIQPVRNQELPQGVFTKLPQKFIHQDFSSLSQKNAPPVPMPGSIDNNPIVPRAPVVPQPIHNEGPKTGRNDPCPCGSGKKYKKCHGA